MLVNKLYIMSLVLGLFLLTVTRSFAQQEEEGIPVLEFEPEVIIGSVEGANELQQDMRDAEVPIREYTQDAIDNIERGAARGLSDFRVWYVHRIQEDNDKELANRRIAEIVGQGLTLGLNQLLPGSGLVITKIREYGQGAYDLAISQLPSGTTNPETYLTELERELLNNDDRLENLMDDMFHGNDAPLQEHMEMVRFEYVLEKMVQTANGEAAGSRRSPGPTTRDLIRQLGIPTPDTNNYDRVRMTSLVSMLYDVMCESGTPVANCDTRPSFFRTSARSVALRLILTGDDIARMFDLNQNELNRVCSVEQSLSYFFMTSDCQEWRSARRN